MSSNYTPSNQNGNLFSNGALGLCITIAIFAFLPAMHLLTGMASSSAGAQVVSSDEPPPPPPPEDTPPPPDQNEPEPEPELSEPPPPMSLSQLEAALNPGAGNAMGDFGFGDFDTGIDALEGMTIFSLADVDKKPVPTLQIEPQMPYSMRQTKTDGWCRVMLVVDPKGIPQRVRAVKSSHKEFEEPAVQAAQRWRFQPGKKDGKNVPVKVLIPFQFNN